MKGKTVAAAFRDDKDPGHGRDQVPLIAFEHQQRRTFLPVVHNDCRSISR